MSDDNPRGADNKDNSSHENTDASGDGEPLIVTIEPQTKNKYSYDAKQYSLDGARFRLEKKAYRTAHRTMVFLIIYTGLTLVVAVAAIVSAVAAKQSANSFERQLEESLAANIDTTVQFDIDQVVVDLQNRGKGFAPWVQLDVTISENSVTSGKPDCEPQPFRKRWEMVRTVSSYRELDPVNIPVRGCGGIDINAIKHLDKFLEVDTEYSFDDGFNRISKNSFCKKLIAKREISNGIHVLGTSFVDCHTAEAAIRKMQKDDQQNDEWKNAQ
jgi:hypothetical protein